MPDVPRAFMDSGGALRRYAWEDETTAVLSALSPLHIVSGGGDTFVQNRYNSRGQLVSRGVWKLRKAEGEDAVKSEMVRESLTEYFYASGASRAERRLVTAGETQEETFYLANGKEARSVLYKTGGDAKELVAQTEYRYDSLGRLTGTAKTEYALLTQPVEDDETRYAYTENSKNANKERFRDGQLIMKTEYLSDTAYTEIRYFDFGFSVEVDYENELPVLERYMQNGKEIRRRRF
jgi:hypothetical protein